jgi:glycosyltransferase involved in cell wall biosynthesis
MSYLINPSGRIVEIDDLKQYTELLNTGEFTKPSKAEIEKYVENQYEKYRRCKDRKEEPTNKEFINIDKQNIYFVTVSQGGKDGYSISSGALIREMRDLGINLNTYYKNQAIAILFHNPYSVLRQESPFRIIYTMFESDKIPDDWQEYLKVADIIIVPSKWCQEVFKRSGINTQVIPLGYDNKVFKFKDRLITPKRKENFTFLHYNAFNIRKGFVEVFKAFTKEFEKDEPVKMIFKTTLSNPPFPINPTVYPNIEVIPGKINDEGMADLCYRSDCFVFPSRGEGFAIPPLEAMATGIPIIVPNAHGITEYFDKNCMYEVAVKETCPALYSRYKNQDVGKMVICDIDDLRRKMRYVYEHQEEAIEIGKLGAKHAQKWTFTNTAIKLKNLIDNIDPKLIKNRQSENLLILDRVS